MQTLKLDPISIFLLAFSISTFGIERARTKAIAEAPQPTPQFAHEFGCKLQPPANPPTPSPPAKLSDLPITLERFRQLLPEPVGSNATPKLINYIPKEKIALADAYNYGDRFFKDLKGNAANRPPIIVLHETREPAESIINYFQKFHSDEADRATYHTLIKIDGTIVYIVPPDKRAFGSGNSVFSSPLAQETVQTNPKYSSSVNNFAYHVSLETPVDVTPNVYFHSGYTNAQYQSLAWLVAKTNVPLERITTNGTVARSRSRIDPRSFNSFLLRQFLRAYPKTQEILIGCNPEQ